jgi:hypothetical protein
VAGPVIDPIPHAPGEDAARATLRLQQTIKNLNARLPAGTIRFRGDGTGRGVRWEHEAAGADVEGASSG